MKGLVDRIHAMGLEAGLYSPPGPTTCQGLGATWQHEEQDARAYARWGFDYLKYDWCGYNQIAPNPTLEDRKKPYKLMGDILKKQDRDIVYSLCQYGAGSVWEWGNDVGGDLWRMTGDINDSWPSMTGIGFQQTGREQFAGPGGWNDTDMMVVGMLGWGATPRPTNLTPNEQLTHMALWSLQAAPLLIGAVNGRDRIPGAGPRPKADNGHSVNSDRALIWTISRRNSTASCAAERGERPSSNDFEAVSVRGARVDPGEQGRSGNLLYRPIECS